MTAAEKTKITALRLDAAKPAADGKPYKIADHGGIPGFFCLVQKKTKTFILSYSLKGKRSEVTLGKYPAVSLSEGRSRAAAARVLVERGEDPAAISRAKKEADKKEKEAPKNTFEAFAAKWQKDKLIGRSVSYKTQIQSRLDRFIFPVIGGKQLEEIKPLDVLKIIQPLQTATPNTAEGTRGIIQAIFNYAVQSLLVESNPAMPLRGIITVPQSENARHLNPKELARFWRTLNAVTYTHASTLAAAKLLVYSMTRKTETIEARWEEFDLDAAIWTIPASRMKTRITHRVYLPTQAVDMLRVHHAITGKLEYVFPSAFRNNVPLGAGTLNHMFKRLAFGVLEFSPHGTRSTAATIMRENGIRRDVVEMLLAHSERGVAAHYHHHELAAERKEALQWYADYIDQISAAAQFASEDLDASDEEEEDPDDEELEYTPQYVVETLGFDPKEA